MRWILLILLIIGCSEIPIEVNETSPVDGVNYYQLIQYDFDGNIEEHPIFMVYKDEPLYLNNGRVAGVTYTSDGSGNWSTDVWDGSIPPLTLGSNDVVNITVGTDVWATDLVVDNYFTLNVYGILDLNSLTLGNNSDISIFEGGTLIIRENINGANSLQVASGGILVVGGNITGSGNSDITNTGGTTYICGTNNVDVNTNTEKTCSDLVDEQPIVADRVSEPLPITLLFQRGIVQHDGSVLIEYETSTERNSDYVSVMWSVDGTRWIELEKIKSKNKPTKYSYLHED